MPETGMPATTNADRLRAAAAALRTRGLPGDAHAALMVELCEPIAVYWAQPYAAPFVPLLEAALRLARDLEPPPHRTGGPDDLDWHVWSDRPGYGWIRDPLRYEGPAAVPPFTTVFLPQARAYTREAALKLCHGDAERWRGGPGMPSKISVQGLPGHLAVHVPHSGVPSAWVPDGCSAERAAGRVRAVLAEYDRRDAPAACAPLDAVAAALDGTPPPADVD